LAVKAGGANWTVRFAKIVGKLPVLVRANTTETLNDWIAKTNRVTLCYVSNAIRWPVHLLLFVLV